MNEYSILLSELNRRKTAYTTLIISLFIGMTISSLDFIALDLSMSLPYLSGFMLFLFLTRVFLLNSFKDFSRVKLFINNFELKRFFKNSTETYLISDIQNIITKRTVRGNVREITLKFRGGKGVCVNALCDLDQFEQEIQRHVDKNVIRIKINEPIDFDHPLYYLFFGLICGISFSILIRVLVFLNEKTLKWISFGFGLYLLATGFYFLTARPITRTFGDKSTIADLLSGLLILLFGSGLFVYFYK